MVTNLVTQWSDAVETPEQQYLAAINYERKESETVTFSSVIVLKKDSSK